MAAVGAFTSMAQAEDLKAFERRLVECIAALGPVAYKWRFILLVTCLITAVTAWNWALDQRTAEVSFFQSLLYHKLFTLSCITLVVLFMMGLHKRIMIQNIVLNRSKIILQDFNMSCDDVNEPGNEGSNNIEICS